MLILNFLPVMIFAFIGEYLRLNYFHLSKIFRQDSAPIVVKPKATVVAPSQSTESDRLSEIKDEGVRELATKYFDL